LGQTPQDNAEVRRHGAPRQFDFPVKDHVDLGEQLGMLDFATATKISGARFSLMTGMLARLHRALGQFMLDVHTREHGYTEVLPPVLVNSASMTGTANLPKFGADAFRIDDRDLWLVPTAEVPLTNFHRDEILDAEALPKKYVAYSPCFRSEAGAAGKDTRGFIRLHQFSKVELVKITAADTSMQEFEGLLADAEEILQRLGLHYQVMLMCSGDMGFAQYKKYDLNAWCPGLGRYLEVSSCSVFNDFQAMRANIRYRPARGQPPRFAHTINGSGLALTRTIDAILESYQRPDGTISVPDALLPYMGGLEVIGRP
jgi:seryl-tRNA synthetase